MKLVRRENYIIKKNNLLFIIIMLSFMEPPLFSQIVFIDNLYLICKLVSAIYALYYSLIRYRSISIMQICTFFFFFSFIISTIVNQGDVYQAIRTIIFNLIACVYLDTSLKKDSETTVRLLRKICVMYIVANVILLIIFPGGFGKYIPGYSMTVDSRLNFLGRDNAFIYFFIFALIIEFLYSQNKRQTYPLLFVITATMLYVWSGTGLIGCVIIALFAFFIQGKKIERIFNIRVLTILYVFIYLGIVILRIQELFSGFIVDVLHKDISFTGRTDLWDMAMAYIAKSPLWGYGVTERFLTMSSGISYSPHNLVLQIILTGGVVSLSFFLLMYFISTRKLIQKDYFYSNLISVAIFSYLIASLTESTMNTQYLYFLFVLAYNISNIEGKYKSPLGKEGD